MSKRTYAAGFVIPDPRSCPEDYEEQPARHTCRRLWCNREYFGLAGELCELCVSEEES